MNTMQEGGMMPRKSWWGRNWPWAVPVGCLGLLLSCGCFGALIFGFAFQSLRGSTVFTEAVDQARESPEVREVLGEPIEAGWQMQGSIQTSNDRGTARFSVPLKGPKAEGTLFVEGTKSSGQWTYSKLQVQVPDHPPLNLLGGPTEPPENTVPRQELPDVEPLPEEDAPAAPGDGKGKPKDDINL